MTLHEPIPFPNPAADCDVGSPVAVGPANHDWFAAGLHYYAYSFFLRHKFGNRRVQKVSLDAGFTCPNVDGTVATGGCTFCDNRSFSPSRRNRLAAAATRRDLEHKILDQLDDGIRRLKPRYDVDAFIAYFQ